MSDGKELNKDSIPQPIEVSPEEFDVEDYGPYDLEDGVPYENTFEMPPIHPFPGVILSGDGSTYDVSVFTSGMDREPETIEVTQLQIAATEVIPEGTNVIVYKVPRYIINEDYTITVIGFSWVMQVPVWL